MKMYTLNLVLLGPCVCWISFCIFGPTSQLSGTIRPVLRPLSVSVTLLHFVTGGWRAAEEEGDIIGSSSLLPLLHHGDRSYEGRRPKHPCSGPLRSLLCHWSHHWQARSVETERQTEHSGRRLEGRGGEGVGHASVTAARMSSGFMLISLLFFF